MFAKLSSILLPLLRRPRVFVSAMLLVQIVLAGVAGLAAFFLRFDCVIPAEAVTCLAWGLAAWAVCKPLSFLAFGALGNWRHFSTPDLVRLIAANTFASAIASCVLVAFCPTPFPRSLLTIDLLLSFLVTAGARAGVRIVSDFTAQSTWREKSRSRTLIYGAGEAGILLLKESRRNSKFLCEICGFIDDVRHRGQLVQGVRVLGGGEDLARVVRENAIDQVLIAIPSADRGQMRRITALCQGAGVLFRTMPALSEIILGSALTKQIRDVALEDVLGRSSVRLEDADVLTKIEGNVVMVTGAAGSIGSELCRQVAQYRPAQLVAFEISETAMFFLEREMKASFPDLVFRPEVGNIQNLQRLRDVFAEYTPKLVLHAAAYKHVPLMEKHMFEAVENNVFGTYNLGLVASEFGVEDFVMISSDKAVNPTNIMGTTKRVAELVIRSLQQSRTRFVSVRFGNVLGSNGSVVPIFKKQIEAGGPVTITHPDMERFFMTIPEASQLVLQACTMGRGGEIFVLDMGEPVKIVDLARQLIRLSGFEPDHDIRIEFTGMRPGEKLYEEINMADELMVSTGHEKIKIFAGSGLLPERMSTHLHRLRKACEQRSAQLLVKELKALVPEYTVGKDVLECTVTESLMNLGRVLQAHSEPKLLLGAKALGRPA